MIKSLAMSAGLSIALAGAAQASSITKDDVLEAQQEWADGIVEISTVYIKKGDYREAAGEHIDDLYAYGESEVLFKPTLAADDQFRETFEEALSYFVGGKIAEDNGFAIKPWSAVRFGEQQIVVNGDTAVAMGNYYFTPAEGGEEVKVEYTFGYVMDENGELKINVHHSSLPFTPAS
ncbi:MAG: phosphoribosyl-AMP cyclohydrolase [Pseudomonadota bacterium]